MNRYVLVLSDCHLAPSVDHERLPFRGFAFSPAPYLSQTIDQAVATARQASGTLEIILAGDVFDFDVAQTGNEATTAKRQGDIRSSVDAVSALSSILSEHQSFTLALRRALASGYTQVVTLPGNHDAQLALENVQNVMRSQVGGALQFRPWYWPAAGGAVHVEHGHQYDPLCAVSRLQPLSGRTEATFGTVSSFYAPLLLPGSDPFVIDPFVERRTLNSLFMYAMSSGKAFLSCMNEVLDVDHDTLPPDSAHVLAVLYGTTPDVIGYCRSRFTAKATLRDLFAVCSGSLDYAGLVEANTRRAMIAACDAHRAQVAVVGHTHRPGAVTLPNGATLLNSGSWTPRRSAGEPVGSYAWVVVDPSGQVREASVKTVERAS